MFVNFVFANTVFVHSHTDGAGNRVVHSHPCLPSSAHSHSASQLAQIAGFNDGASSVMGSASLHVATDYRGDCVTVVTTPAKTRAIAGTHAQQLRRGPPPQPGAKAPDCEILN